MARAGALHAARGDTDACDVAYAHFKRLAPPERRLAEASSRARQAKRSTPPKTLLRRALAELAAGRGGVAHARGNCGGARRLRPAERLLEECLRLAPGYSRARLDLATSYTGS